MKKLRIPLLLLIVLLAGIAASSYVLATPSDGFQEVNGEVFDDWGVCRTRSYGNNGFYQITETTFRPVIAMESLGEGTDPEHVFPGPRKQRLHRPDPFEQPWAPLLSRSEGELKPS